MSKYSKLAFYLASLDANSWDATFDEVENALGIRLPPSARQHQAWWSNQRRAQSLGWEGAGWRTTAVDLANERVTFVYVDAEDDTRPPKVTPLTIAEAKAGLAAAFAVPIDAIEIVIRG